MTLKHVKDPFSRKGLLFAKMSYIFAKRTFMMFNIIKLKLNDINLSIYAVEIVFETIFHGNGRLTKRSFIIKKELCI